MWAFAFASTSLSNVNNASMVMQTQTHRMGLNPFSVSMLIWQWCWRKRKRRRQVWRKHYVWYPLWSNIWDHRTTSSGEWYPYFSLRIAPVLFRVRHILGSSLVLHLLDICTLLQIAVWSRWVRVRRCRPDVSWTRWCIRAAGCCYRTATCR